MKTQYTFYDIEHSGDKNRKRRWQYRYNKLLKQRNSDELHKAT